MRRTLVLLLTMWLPLAAQAQPAASSAQAAARLRSLWYDQAYLDGTNEAVELVRRFPRSPEVRAWFLINYTTAGYVEQAIDSGVALAKQFPSSPWIMAARGHAMSQDYERSQEGVVLARRAYRAAPTNADIGLLTALAIQRSGRYDAAIGFLDTLIKKFGATGELLSLQGYVLATRSRQRDADSTLLPRARVAFSEAQRIAPNNVNAWYRPATSLGTVRGDTMTHAMLRRAAELSPHASAIHSRYWSAIQARADLSDSAKRAEIEADLARFLAGREADPAFLYPAVSAYATMKQADKVRALQERILNEFPTRRQAELVAYDRLTLRDGRELTDTAAARREHRRLVREYLARPYHYWKSGLGTIYLDHLYDVRSDSTTSDSALLAAIRGTVKYNRINPHITHYDLPLLLADRKLDLALATTLANESLDRWKTQLDGMTSYATAGEMIDRRTTVTAQKYDMLGWIAFHKGQLAEAEKQLERAREMSNQNSLNYYHLGRVAEARGNAIQAEQHFARGYQLETSGFARRTENAKELKRLYAARHASLDGFDTYVERLKEEDRGRRRTKIANARIKDPKDVPPFSLERLSLDSAATAARVSSSSLRGKIVVVNFWGTWCGPCVGEMPELQKFHDRFKNDSNVVFLTVDYNDDKKTVKDWMLQRKFTMPVLLDDGYVRDRAKINAYPTTWFIDQDGKIAFMHVGASEVVLEEFTWRVEMLKGTNAVP